MTSPPCKKLWISCALCTAGILSPSDCLLGQTVTTVAGSAVQPPRDGQHDFDFLPGAWKVHNRRLTNPLSGSTKWMEFEGTSVTKKVWDGRANMDEYEAESPSGHIEGLTVRLYNPKSGEWSLYWANQRNGTMETPTIGEFKNGRGDFYDQEVFQGRSIYVRYSWLDIKPDACRWEQAFSMDGGKTWETNWIMEMTRAGGEQ